jgi:signal transduction histidine kinase
VRAAHIRRTARRTRTARRGLPGAPDRADWTRAEWTRAEWTRARRTEPGGVVAVAGAEPTPLPAPRGDPAESGARSKQSGGRTTSGWNGRGGEPDDALRQLPGRAFRWASVLVPAILGTADALLVNGVTLGLELNVSLVAAGALLLRHRFPVTVFLATLPGILIGYIWFAPMIALYTVAVRRPGRTLLTVSALLLAAAHFVPWPISDLQPTAFRENTLTLLDSFVTSVTPIALGLLVRTRGELAARIAELTRSRRRADQLIAEQVLSTERARLAREMHDVVAHQVSLISLQAGAVQISSADPNSREVARTIRELSVRTLDELRHMVGILRAAGGDLDELTPQPRLADLPRLIELSALDVTYEIRHTAGGHPVQGGTRYAEGSGDGDGDEYGNDRVGNGGNRSSGSSNGIGSRAVDGGTGYGGEAAAQERFGGRSEAVERAAFRVVQEALTNVRKHAPGARVRVRVSETGHPEGVRVLSVEVRNGPPDATAQAPGLPGGGHGLIGLRERAQLLGGTLDARPTDDGGFMVCAELPEPA